MTHDKDILIRASDYLDYDVDMLFATASWLTSTREPKSLISNAILESFLVHARNLIEFLSGSGYGNAVRAIHYFEQLPESTYQPKISPFLLTTKDRISTHLAHLTTEPLDNLRSTIGWDIRKILLDLWEGLEAFYKVVPYDFVLSDYDRRIRDYRDRISQWQPKSKNVAESPGNHTSDTEFS